MFVSCTFEACAMYAESWLVEVWPECGLSRCDLSLEDIHWQLLSGLSWEEHRQLI